MEKDHHKVHVPVLQAEVLQYLAPEKGETLLDVTAGYGGHASSILERTERYEGSALVDRDAQAIEALNDQFRSYSIEIIHSDFVHATKRLRNDGQTFAIILADLGVSSMHLNNATRGFSFSKNGPLDMRMDQRQMHTAADIVNTASEKELAEMLHQFGDEVYASQIARAVIANRPLETTLQLASLVENVYKKKRKNISRIHPATKTFQALRIAVNDELAQLYASLPLWIEMLQTGGRLGVISFHSSEDRIVKRMFNSYGGERYDAVVKIVTKKPIVASKQEVVFNPRARSAKLRVVVKK